MGCILSPAGLYFDQTTFVIAYIPVDNLLLKAVRFLSLTGSGGTFVSDILCWFALWFSASFFYHACWLSSVT